MTPLARYTEAYLERYGRLPSPEALKALPKHLTDNEPEPITGTATHHPG